MRSSHHSLFITIAALARKRSSTLKLESVLRSSLLHEDVQACADVRRYERKALSSMSMDERTMLDSMSTTMRDVPSLWSVPSLWVTKRRFTGAALVRDAPRRSYARRAVDLFLETHVRASIPLIITLFRISDLAPF
jgi:hypothetical protein